MREGEDISLELPSLLENPTSIHMIHSHEIVNSDLTALYSLTPSIHNHSRTPLFAVHMCSTVQKIARDRLIEFHGDPSSGSEEEQAACMGIGMAMMAVAGEKPTKASKAAAWAASWKEIYGLADLVMERILDEWVPVSVGQSKL